MNNRLGSRAIAPVGPEATRCAENVQRLTNDCESPLPVVGYPCRAANCCVVAWPTSCLLRFCRRRGRDGGVLWLAVGLTCRISGDGSAYERPSLPTQRGPPWAARQRRAHP